MIKIIDCGSQLTHNIARRIRELGVYTEIVPYNKADSILANSTSKPNNSLDDILGGTDILEGIIISGGQYSVYDKGSPLYAKEILSANVPILGICYGHQSIAHLLGGDVVPANNREYGCTKIRICDANGLFKNLPSEFNVWMSHADIVGKMPPDFEAIAYSENGHIASMQKDNIYTLQFHPEVDHTENGRKILENFLDICNAAKNWDPSKAHDKIIDEITAETKGKIIIGGISGGIDSTAASVLMKNICGKDYHPIFVNNGLLRMDEEDEVMAYCAKLGLDVHYVDASKEFLQNLRRIENPDEKRKIIGHTFIKIFEETAKKIGKADCLMQGTLYPDVIESVPIYGSSSKIKRHHNVGGLPDKMGLEVIEPFRTLFKDEVRGIAQKLRLPKEIIWRHPFPGPGLAVRIVGEVTQEKLDLLRQADKIFIDELKSKNIYYDISQAFAVLTNAKSVGVMGDEGNYQGIIALRAVTTNDFMTSDWYEFKKDDLTAIANKIINQVKGINRVVYDITQKPPGTIEWE